MKHTKLKLLLMERGLTQTELYNMIVASKHSTIGKDRISKMVSGTHDNYTIQTAKAIADVLFVKIDEIID
jgi:DNA-binding Xre family transcriptional regulator